MRSPARVTVTSRPTAATDGSAAAADRACKQKVASSSGRDVVAQLTGCGALDHQVLDEVTQLVMSVLHVCAAV